MDWAFGHGVLLLIDGPCSGLFIYLFARSGCEPESSPGPNLYIQIYIYTHTHTYTYLYVYIYMSIYSWGREGAVMRRLKTMSSHRRWYDQSSGVVLGHGKKLIFLFYRSYKGGARASWFPCGQGSEQQLQAGLMLGPGLGFQFRCGRWTFLGMATPHQWTPLAFFIAHRHERVYVFSTFFCGRDGIRNQILFFISPSPF